MILQVVQNRLLLPSYFHELSLIFDVTHGRDQLSNLVGIHSSPNFPYFRLGNQRWLRFHWEETLFTWPIAIFLRIHWLIELGKDTITGSAVRLLLFAMMPRSGKALAGPNAVPYNLTIDGINTSSRAWGALLSFYHGYQLCHIPRSSHVYTRLTKIS